MVYRYRKSANLDPLSYQWQFRYDRSRNLTSLIVLVRHGFGARSQFRRSLRPVTNAIRNQCITGPVPAARSSSTIAGQARSSKSTKAASGRYGGVRTPGRRFSITIRRMCRLQHGPARPCPFRRTCVIRWAGPVMADALAVCPGSTTPMSCRQVAAAAAIAWCVAVVPVQVTP